MSLHPLTLKSIEAVFKRLGGCSCEEDDTMPKGWWLCNYHYGFEDAAVAQQERLDEAHRLVVEIREALARGEGDVLLDFSWPDFDGGKKPNGE